MQIVCFPDNAKRYIGGVAWHGYAGRHDAPGSFHNNHPDVGKFCVLTFSLQLQSPHYPKAVLCCCCCSSSNYYYCYFHYYSPPPRPPHYYYNYYLRLNTEIRLDKC